MWTAFGSCSSSGLLEPESRSTEIKSSRSNRSMADSLTSSTSVAATHINLLPESDCLRRSTTDAKHREQIVKSHAPMFHEHIDWSSKLERAKEAAVTVAMVRTEDIIQVAREIDKYIETKIDVPCEIVEQWQGIQDARAFGEAMRKRQPDVPIP